MDCNSITKKVVESYSNSLSASQFKFPIEKKKSTSFYPSYIRFYGSVLIEFLIVVKFRYDLHLFYFNHFILIHIITLSKFTLLLFRFESFDVASIHVEYFFALHIFVHTHLFSDCIKDIRSGHYGSASGCK